MSGLRDIKSALILVLIVHFIFPLAAQDDNMKFKYITMEDGLSQSSVEYVYQDSFGFIWIATQNGMNCYDGCQIKIYKPSNSNPNNLSHHLVSSIVEDNLGNLWVGTLGGGLNRLNRNTEEFTYYRANDFNKHGLSCDIITSLYCAMDGTLWLGTEDGLFSYSTSQDRFELFSCQIIGEKQLVENYVYSIFEDTKNGIWIASDKGLYHYNQKSQSCNCFPEIGKEVRARKFTSLGQDSYENIWIGSDKGLFKLSMEDLRNKHFSFSHYPIYDNDQLISSISTLASGTGPLSSVLFIGTQGNGLIALNLQTTEHNFIRAGNSNKQGLINNYVSSLTFDRANLLWVGTEGGVCIYDYHANIFTLYNKLPFIDREVALRNLHSIVKDDRGILWLASKGDGIYVIDEIKQKSVNLTTESTKGKLSSNKIRTLFQDSKKNFWIGSDDKGLIVAEETWFGELKVRNLDHDETIPDVLKKGQILAVLESRDGLVWIGSEKGLHCYNYATNKFTSYYHNPDDPRSISDDYIYCLFEDAEDQLWIGTFDGGLNKMDRKQERFISYQYNHEDTSSIGCNDVSSICQDRVGRIWLGLIGGGVNMFDKEKKTFLRINESNGLPSNIVYGVMEDNRGKIWLSSNYGLSCVEPVSLEISNYTQSDGLQSNEFNGGASFKDKSGIMYFGGKFGLNKFLPEEIVKNKYVPNVVFTDLHVFDQRIIAGDKNNILSKSISETEKVTLKYQQNHITFSFASLSYSGSDKNNYSYILEGFMDDWLSIGNKHSVTFTNLNPDEYILKVKGSNNDGVWNENPVELMITVLPPVWKRWWAYGCYFIFLGALVFSLVKNSQVKMALVNDLKIEKINRQKTVELNELKLKFFTNISHELRTPLSLILGPIDNLLSNGRFSFQEIRQLQLMKKNTLYLKGLLDNLMTFRKLEKGKMMLKVGKADLKKVLINCYSSFNGVATTRGIIFNHDFPNAEFYGWFDQKKIEMLLYNLLANAFKYSHDSATIKVTLRILDNKKRAIANESLSGDEFLNQRFAEISVHDTGIGIPQNKLEYIFERFAQIESTSPHGYSDSIGIGLAITKEIVDLHKGKIRVHSKENEGTIFTVNIPVSREAYSDAELSNQQLTNPSAVTKAPHLNMPDPLDKKSDIYDDSAKLMSRDKDLPKMLIIEDNKDLREFLVNSFENQFNVETAVDGDDSLRKVSATIPDIIISDVLMPGKDGIVVCRTIRKEIPNYVPIILLTAKSMDESKYEGFDAGADAYITKPFSIKLLKLRVHKLLESRRLLKEYFHTSDMIHVDSLRFSSVDEKFLRKAMKVIESNIGESEFNVSELANSVAMSRSHLYRKIKSLTGQMPNDFIKSVRLNHAANLLKKQKYTISDISYHVGFNDPKYFSKCFKKKFNLSPTSYSETHLKDKA